MYGIRRMKMFACGRMPSQGQRQSRLELYELEQPVHAR